MKNAAGTLGKNRLLARVRGLIVAALILGVALLIADCLECRSTKRASVVAVCAIAMALAIALQFWYLFGPFARSIGLEPEASTRDDQLREGSIVEVMVSSVEDFGLFVEFEGNKGVVLVTNLYWDRVEAHRRMVEEFKAGQRLAVKVLAVTPEQFSASIKHVQPEQDPWRDPGIYATGTTHRGVVRLVFDNGAALVHLENGVDVIVEKLKPQTSLRDRVDVVINAMDVDTQRIWGDQV